MDNFQSPVPEYMIQEARYRNAGLYADAEIYRCLEARPSRLKFVICGFLRFVGETFLRASDYLESRNRLRYYGEEKHAF